MQHYTFFSGGGDFETTSMKQCCASVQVVNEVHALYQRPRARYLDVLQRAASQQQQQLSAGGLTPPQLSPGPNATPLSGRAPPLEAAAGGSEGGTAALAAASSADRLPEQEAASRNGVRLLRHLLV
jgi:hypothetical protein